MMRWIATVGIALLLLLTVVLPWTAIGRRGAEAALRSDVEGAVGTPGARLPALDLVDLSMRLVASRA